MSTANPTCSLPDPLHVQQQISALEDELKALRRLLRASKAAAKAEEARDRRLALRQTGGPVHVG